MRQALSKVLGQLCARISPHSLRFLAIQFTLLVGQTYFETVNLFRTWIESAVRISWTIVPRELSCRSADVMHFLFVCIT